jgi:putative ABC transport system permease protein
LRSLAVFSAVDAMLLRPMQFRDASRLLKVFEDGSKIGFPRNTPAPANVVDWKVRNHPVTANLFPLLGVAPALGRNFLPEEDRPGGPKVAILSFRLWQQRYGAERSVIGRGVRLDGETYQIVGIMPHGFIFPDRSDVWVPIAFRPDQLAQRSNHYLRVYARLKSDVTVESAQREMAGIGSQLAHEYPAPIHCSAQESSGCARRCWEISGSACGCWRVGWDAFC